jgi:hypothetical protein
MDGLPDCHYLSPFAFLPPAWVCGNNKVFVSHINGRGQCNTLCVSYNAAQAHLNHGDYLGPCNHSNCGGNFMIPNFSGDFEVGHNEHIELFPNPASDEITIRLHDIDDPTDIVLADQLGKVMIRIPLKEGQNEWKVALESLNAGNGIYFVTIKHRNGILIRHFVIAR